MPKDILVDYDRYGVTPCGIVYSKTFTEEVKNRWGSFTRRTRKGKVIKSWPDSKGRYLYVNLGKDLRISVHRLVAITYLDNPHMLPHVNHKDGNPQNNRVNNLEWVSASQNARHTASLGKICGPYGKQRLVKSCETDRLIMAEYEKRGSIKAMEGFMGCTRSTIGRYIKNRNLIQKHKVNQHG